MKKEPCSIFLSAKGRCFHRKNIGMKSVLFTILLQYTIFRRNFQENFFFFFYRKSELKSFSSGLCGASGFRLACSPSHVGVSCRTTPCGSALFAGPRPAPRRPLLKKGSIRKLFCGRATYFLWKGKESGMPEPLIFGNWSMDTGRRPLCGCFVLSCMVGGIFRKPLGFRRRLPPARPEKA